MSDRYNRREFLGTAGWGVASMAMSGSRADAAMPARRRPNVILVNTDDQGYGDLACHGNPVIQTPNLDALHGQSVRLTNYHVCPTCTPTRAALMTGRYSLRTGVWHTIMGRSIMRRDEVTMGNVFSAGGYRTGIFGKWHLGDSYPYRPQDRGFGETLIHGGGGVGQTPDYWGNDYFDDTYFRNGTPEKCTGYCTDVFFGAAMRFIEANKDRPFFCYLPTNAPHGPYNVADKYSKPYRDKGVKDRQAAFFGMITNIDENMGRLVRRLKELDLERDTILIFMTDNGSSGGAFNAQMRGKKGSQYDGGHRVPCFIRWPGGKLGGGRDIATLTAHIDLMPTLIDLCGLSRPDGVRFDGTSIVPLLRGRAETWPDRTLFVDCQRIEQPAKWRRCAAMTDRWRLIDGKALYDMRADPSQKRDVAGQHADVVKKLRAEYEAWWDDISERFDEYCEIVIGAKKAPEVRIACHDWHGPKVPWNQPHIRAGLVANGFWAVDVAHGGEYEFALRRWPVEVDKPINAAVPGGKAIRATQARLKIGEADRTRPVGKDDCAATFRVKLEPGKTRLETWLTDDTGTSRGAYYVYARRLSPR